MQEVVCFNCGRIVHISPDAERCSVCGENLRELIHPAYSSTYFYDRAAQMAADDDLLQALREIDRGLRYHDSSELRLLGAILSQRIGDVEQMRHHVSAIPVDDVLRSEAEWLLRSHQTRQRAQRTGGQSKHRQPPSLAELDPLPPLPQRTVATVPTRSSVSTTERSTRHRGFRSIAIYAGLLVIALIATGIVLGSGDQLLAYVPWLRAQSEASLTDELAAPVQRALDTPATVDAEGQPDGQTGQETPGIDGEATTVEPTATPLPTIELQVPDDLVEVPAPLAESTSALLVTLEPFALQTYLLESGRADLAELDVTATSLDGIIRLNGIVPAFQDRQDLMTLMESAPGVTRVSTADLLVRLPPTYTVEAGDTLWAISAKLYGENRIDALLAANRETLASADTLRVGMELVVPAIE